MTLMAALLVSLASWSATKQALRVLYVGGSSNIETMGVGQLDSAVVAASAAERMADFKQLLEANFTQVKCIDAKDWKWQMSRDYDVTIMDGTPVPLKPQSYKYGPDGRISGVIYAEYTPQDFDRAMLSIANASEELGRGIGVKNDWYCLCLENDAYGMKLGHDIFNAPLKVNLTIEEKPTPEAAFEYQFEYDEPIAKTQQMWTVQTGLYADTETRKELRIGMVARPGGYLDSPDTEIISGGHSAKSPDAIAIGRHANWFHWGFAASPKNMTEEAQQVFVNAVCYASRFNGHRIIARKYNETIATSGTVRDMQYFVTRACTDDQNREIEKSNEMIREMQKGIKEKQERGEELTPMEKMYADIEPFPLTDYETSLKRAYPDIYARFGTDEQAMVNYYKDNAPYFYGERDGYTLLLDEDAKAWQIKVGSMELLEKAVKTLDSDNADESARARRILERYTLLRYTDSKDWQNWYATYHDNIFFTESGGWLYLVNSLDKQVPGNDYSVIRGAADNTAPTATPTAGTTDDRNPVSVVAVVNRVSDTEQELVVRMHIHPGYHTYGIVSDDDPFIPTTIEIEPADGYTLKGDLQRPSFKLLNSSGTTIYENDAIWRQRLTGSGEGQVKVNIGWQVCNNDICLQPQQKTLSVVIKQ